MPGVFVLAGTEYDGQVRRNLLTRMIRLDKERSQAPFGPRRDWVVETVENESCAVGCAHLGVYQQTAIASCTKPRKVDVVAHGNISSRASSATDDGQTSAAEMVLEMYLARGANFVEDLDGAFVIVVSEPDARRLLVFNDRLGELPHYFATSKSLFAMAPNLSAVGCLPGVDDSVDMEGLCDLLTFGYILKDDTILKGVKVLPPACAAEYRDGSWRPGSYWQLKVEPGRTPSKPTRAHIEEIGELMSEAVRRCVPKHGRVTVSLSGGLDSRFVACALAKEGIPFDALTVGADECCDVKFSRMLCERLGVEQTVVSPLYDEGSERLSWLAKKHDGVVNMFHQFGASHFISHAVPDTEIKLTGWLGGVIGGYNVLPRMFYLRPGKINDYLAEEYGKVLPSGVRKVLDSQDSGYQVSPHHRIAEITSASVGDGVFAVTEDFEHSQEQRKYTVLGNRTADGDMETRSPFTDRDLMEYFLGLPLSLLFLKRLFRRAIASLFPDASHVPWTFVDLPPKVSSARIIFRRLGKRGRLPEPIWRVWQKLFWVPDHPGHKYRDFDLLLSRMLPQMRDLFFDQGGAAAPGLDADGVRDILEDYASGNRDYSNLLMHLFSYIAWYASRPSRFSAERSRRVDVQLPPRIETDASVQEAKRHQSGLTLSG